MPICDNIKYAANVYFYDFRDHCFGKRTVVPKPCLPNSKDTGNQELIVEVSLDAVTE